MFTQQNRQTFLDRVEAAYGPSVKETLENLAADEKMLPPMDQLQIAIDRNQSDMIKANYDGFLDDKNLGAVDPAHEAMHEKLARMPTGNYDGFLDSESLGAIEPTSEEMQKINEEFLNTRLGDFDYSPLYIAETPVNQILRLHPGELTKDDLLRLQHMTQPIEVLELNKIEIKDEDGQNLPYTAHDSVTRLLKLGLVIRGDEYYNSLERFISPDSRRDKPEYVMSEVGVRLISFLAENPSIYTR